MGLKKQILFLDDDTSFLEKLSFSLEPFYSVVKAHSIQDAQTALAHEKVDAIVLDYYLGLGENGHDFLDYLHENYNTPPVIVISGQVDLPMTIGFLKRQVQDFLEKPFTLTELLVSLEKVLSPKKAGGVLGFEIDMNTRKVTVDDQEIVLTPTEFEILNYFILHRGQRVQRAEIVSHIWGRKQVSPNAFDTHLLNLKKKLPPFAQHLTSVYGSGYCYEP
ncbi:MAG: response regulator transcription factor [Bdellovibrionales bacterium]|nr:response regulator transcription factor [Bdellovibrionales bacterium]